ncbi:MAG: hypothetical protein F9Y92_04295 [Thermoplasmatales archaeon]|nr:hypothetical protein [Thermoplasmatales archaeon]
MTNCKDCEYAFAYIENTIICLNKKSLNYGRVQLDNKRGCEDFIMGRCKVSMNPPYLWCETCKRTIYPQFEFKEHINHDVWMDKDIESIMDYSDIILTGAD